MAYIPKNPQEEIQNTPKKHGHSYWSFFWTAAKMAKKRAWAQYGNLLVFASLFQCGLLAECISKITKGVDVNFWLTFSPVLISIFGFVVFLFHATHKIYERDLGQSNTVTEVESEPPKPAMFVLFIVVVLACVGLVAGIIVLQRTQIEHLRSQIPKPRQLAVAPKPLPEQIIPQREIISSPPVANTEAPILLETNEPTVGDAESALNKAVSEKKAEAEIENKTCQANDQTRWAENAPLFNYSLRSLYGILNTEAAKPPIDGIVIPESYYKCLPLVIDYNMAETNITWIKFQIKTNVNFVITITKAGMINGPQYIQPNGLRISCGCGYLEIQPYWYASGNHLHRIIRVPALNDDKTVPDDNPHKFIDDGLKILVAAQIDHLKQTNK